MSDQRSASRARGLAALHSLSASFAEQDYGILIRRAPVIASLHKGSSAVCLPSSHSIHSRYFDASLPAPIVISARMPL